MHLVGGLHLAIRRHRRHLNHEPTQLLKNNGKWNLKDGHFLNSLQHFSLKISQFWPLKPAKLILTFACMESYTTGSLIDFGIDAHNWSSGVKSESQESRWAPTTISLHTCINDTASSSCETAWFQVNLSGHQGRQGKEKDEKEDEKPQIQSGTVRGTEGK